MGSISAPMTLDTQLLLMMTEWCSRDFNLQHDLKMADGSPIFTEAIGFIIYSPPALIVIAFSHVAQRVTVF